MKFYEICKEYLKREEVKQELFSVIKPILISFYDEFYPYILFLFVLIILSVMLLFTILYNLVRLRNYVYKRDIVHI